MKPGLISFVFFILNWLIIVSVPAVTVPRPLSTDDRIKQVVFDPNQVVDIVGTYGYVTTIEFSPDEVIKGRTFGDSIAWQTLIKDNHLYIKPVEPEASGNMTIVTNKHTYFFKLSTSTKNMTYLVRFKYPALLIENELTHSNNRNEDHTSKGIQAAAINMNYVSAGHKALIQLIRVFDDGEFTYFQFDRNAEIPSFYLVGNDGTESIVNTRRDGAYMVVERTGNLFTLRNGSVHLCVKKINQNNGGV